MATQILTDPPLLNSTGLSIVSAIQGVAAACKPDATEINMGPSDSTKVSAAIASANTAIANVSTSSDTIVSDIAGVKSALTTFASSMSVGESKLVRIVHTDTSDTSIMQPSVRYEGLLTKNATDGFSWLASGYQAKNPVIFSYYSGGSVHWVAEKISVNYDLDKISRVPNETTIASVDAFKTHLLSLFNSATNLDIVNDNIVTQSVNDSHFENSTRYVGYIICTSTTQFSGLYMNRLGDMLSVACENITTSPTWHIDKVALNSNIANVQNGLAYIVGNTNTTGSTLGVGQFVYVKGHSTIAEGLRKVTASISANGSITTSNTTACSEGGLNALNSNKLNFYEATFPNITLENGTQTIQLTQDASGFPDVVAKSIIFTSALYNVYYQWASQSSTNKINVTTTWYINAKNERGSQISGVTIKALVLY